MAPVALGLVVLATSQLSPATELNPPAAQRADIVLPAAPVRSQPLIRSQPQTPALANYSVGVASAPKTSPRRRDVRVAPVREVKVASRIVQRAAPVMPARSPIISTSSAALLEPRAVVPSPAPSNEVILAAAYTAPAPASPGRRLSAAAPAVPTVAVVNVNDELAIQRIIHRYEAAYETLDARAAKQIWPSLDERALARAFSGLSSQKLVFEPCRINVTSRQAVASCRGYATYVGRVGTKGSQSQQRDWQFVLRKSNDSWQIGSVETQ